MIIQDISQILQNNAYPGRGIILGRSADDRKVIIAYFIMGRSENSRNRIFAETEDGIRTQAFDPSKMVDPSLIIYHPVRKVGEDTIVTNGDQTDTIRDYLLEGKSYVDGLRTRSFEPDAPNFTPRISGIVHEDGSYALSILKSNMGDETGCNRYFFDYSRPKVGLGHFIHTYQEDGNPLPSFAGEPVVIRTEYAIHEFSELLWNSLHNENKVSLFVRYIDIATGMEETVIKNKNC